MTLPIDPKAYDRSQDWFAIDPMPINEVFKEMYAAWWEKISQERLKGPAPVHKAKVRKPSPKTMQKYRIAVEQIRQGRKKTRIAADLGYSDFRALNKMITAVERYLQFIGRK